MDSRTREMLSFATKLTVEPHSMEEGDVQKLRSFGLSDEQILSVVLITCVFSFMDRIMLGLGVEFSLKRHEAIGEWLVGPAREQKWLMSKDKPSDLATSSS